MVMVRPYINFRQSGSVLARHFACRESVEKQTFSFEHQHEPRSPCTMAQNTLDEPGILDHILTQQTTSNPLLSSHCNSALSPLHTLLCTNSLKLETYWIVSLSPMKAIPHYPKQILPEPNIVCSSCPEQPFDNDNSTQDASNICAEPGPEPAY